MPSKRTSQCQITVSQQEGARESAAGNGFSGSPETKRQESEKLPRINYNRDCGVNQCFPNFCWGDPYFKTPNEP